MIFIQYKASISEILLLFSKNYNIFSGELTLNVPFGDIKFLAFRRREEL